MHMEIPVGSGGRHRGILGHAFWKVSILGFCCIHIQNLMLNTKMVSILGFGASGSRRKHLKFGLLYFCKPKEKFREMAQASLLQQNTKVQTSFFNFIGFRGPQWYTILFCPIFFHFLTSHMQDSFSTACREKGAVQWTQKVNDTKWNMTLGHSNWLIGST